MYETYDFCQRRVKNSYDKCSNFVENLYSFFGYKHKGICILIQNIIRCIFIKHEVNSLSFLFNLNT